MRRYLLVLALAIAATAIAGLPVLAGNGNGAPSGPHYNLNIIGVDHKKDANMTGSNGHVIFVPSWGNAKIDLRQGSDFKVLDANATKGKAVFQLPNPDVDGDGVTTYSVWARALGKPGGEATMTTCAYDIDYNEWCSTDALLTVRGKGKQSFSDVSDQLLNMDVDLDGDGVDEAYSIFDPTLQDYFWDYDNRGLKLLQLRFYEVPSSIQ